MERLPTSLPSPGRQCVAASLRKTFDARVQSGLSTQTNRRGSQAKRKTCKQNPQKRVLCVGVVKQALSAWLIRTNKSARKPNNSYLLVDDRLFVLLALLVDSLQVPLRLIDLFVYLPPWFFMFRSRMTT